MEIITAGTKEKMYQNKTFQCPECGCIFKANKQEYDYRFSPRNEEFYVCKCPMNFCDGMADCIDEEN